MHPEGTDGEGLAEQICKAVVETFDGVKTKSGKPVVRSNGISEWSVLSGLVAINSDTKEISVLSIATGVKAMPDCIREYSKGWIVHDMHAEILCLRQFNWFLIEEANKVQNGEESEFIRRSESSSRFRFCSKFHLALYVSEPPCGDCSMAHIAGDSEAWEAPPEKKQKITRGRAHFDKKGIVRTKPGRSDSLVTLSKSCSDKLCAKQELGITNTITSEFMEPIFLRYLVVSGEKLTESEFHRSFARVNVENGIPLQILPFTSKDNYAFHKSQTSEPSPLSLVHCPPAKITHVISNGVRNGAYIKNKPPKPSGASILCNRRLVEKARPLLKPADSYSALKRSNIHRNASKANVRAQLVTWVPTTEDDFDMH